jgi:hypothetical protein
MHLPDSKRYSDTNWFFETSRTRVDTLHAFYQPGVSSIAFGLKGTLDDAFVRSLISFLDGSLWDKVASGGARILLGKVGGFDGCAVLSDVQRSFLRGWAGAEGEIMHAFPVFSCELDENGSLPPFAQFKRAVDVFSHLRQPEPYFKFKMSDGSPQFTALKWSAVRYSTFQGYIDVLRSAKNSSLEVRNRRGEVLSFSTATGWDNALGRVHEHLVGAG